MATYATMQADIADELLNQSALTSAQIKKAIERAIASYERRPWWFNTLSGTFLTVAGQEYYTTPAASFIPNMIEIQSAMITVSGSKQRLDPALFSDIEEAQTSNGVPTRYAMLTGQIRLFPVPNSVYTVTLGYVGRLAALVNAADENAWTTFAEELIRQAAKRRLAMDITDDDGLALRCKALETEAYTDLMHENRRRNPVKLRRVDLPGMSSTFDIASGM